MLPPPLLDLLCQRLSAFGGALNPSILVRGQIRRVQQLAPAARPRFAAHAYGIPISKASRSGSKKVSQDGYALRAHQAQKEVQALTEMKVHVAPLETASVLSTTAERGSYEGLHFPEAALRDIYADLLSHPEADVIPSEEESSADVAQIQCPDIAQTLEERLPTFEAAVDYHAANTSSLSARLLARMPQNLSLIDDKQDHVDLQNNGSSLRTLMTRLLSAFDRLHATWSCVPSSSEAIPIPFGVFSKLEWTALLGACLDANDIPSSERVLVLMKRLGIIPSNEQYDAILNWYAVRGLVDEADGFFSRLAIDVSRDRQRDLLVKARVAAKRLDDACALIHSLETQITPAPMQSYTRVIRALFSQRGPGSEQCKARAWDMFSHMRYVAHATPDHFLYTVMMRACAESAEPEPERALDLFTEMTIDKGIPATTYSYNAVILTCARARNFGQEAFRLAHEMLNSHRDAHGELPASLRPDNVTFCALLEAAKRMGDLPRVRWILAQMTNYAQATHGSERPIYIDEQVMTHVFHAYAAYRPPFHRGAVVVKPGDEADAQHVRDQDHAGSVTQEQGVEAVNTRHYPGAPQSRQEVIKESSVILERIKQDRQAARTRSRGDTSLPYLVFGRVSPTSTLLNAYMAVHYAHSPPSAACKVYASLYEDLGIARDAFTHVLALEAYAHGKRVLKEEEQDILSFGRNVWQAWRRLEDERTGPMSDRATGSSGLDARVVERAWRAMMRLLSLHGRLDEAIDLVHQFVERYPPYLVKQLPTTDVDHMQSTRTSLYAERPIVRLRERSTVPEDRVSPFLTFGDLSLLHHRAIAARRTEHIKYITWVAKTYEGALRRRQEATFRPRSVATTQK